MTSDGSITTRHGAALAAGGPPAATAAGPASSAIDAEGRGAAPWRSRLASGWDRVERLLVLAGDWLNPILVKETRQAMKSWQFTMTFVLVLVACWVVTIGGVALIGPGIYYSAAGGTMLIAYYTVLAFPLTVVVPYAAFRSLAAEREDNTYDLLSITTLRPHQIISGKLGSSVVQMAVYFSAITPCLAFTYLLRGVDLPTIAVLLGFTFFGSLGLSMLGLLLATLTRQRFGQVFISVAFIALVLMLFWTAVAGLANTFIQYGYAFVGSAEFWGAATAWALWYVTTFALAYFAAAGMITFTSENRSTPLRIAMLVQHATLTGLMAFVWIADDFDLRYAIVYATLSGLYWYVMGALVTAERPQMSERVKRRLPNTFLSRAFFTWLNPGPATGYMFIVANATSVVLLCLLAAFFVMFTGRSMGVTTTESIYLVIIGWGYLVGYLGLGRLVIAALRRVAVVTMLAAALIHFLLVLAGSGIPTTIQLMSTQLRYDSYSYLQLPNPFWSLIHVASGGLTTEGPVLAFVVPSVAICILLLNLGGVVRELRQQRVALPARVAEDEAQLHPPPVPGPSSPWDEPQ